MHSLLALIRLDLKLFFRDRRALILLFLVPIGVASFVGALTDSASGDRSQRAGLQLIVDLDHSAVSRGIVQQFTSDNTFRVTVTNEAAARDQILLP